MLPSDTSPLTHTEYSSNNMPLITVIHQTIFTNRTEINFYQQVNWCFFFQLDLINDSEQESVNNILLSLNSDNKDPSIGHGFLMNTSLTGRAHWQPFCVLDTNKCKLFQSERNCLIGCVRFRPRDFESFSDQAPHFLKS